MAFSSFISSLIVGKCQTIWTSPKAQINVLTRIFRELLPKTIQMLTYVISASSLYMMYIFFVLAGLASSAILRKNNKYLTALNTWLKPVVQSKSSAWKRCWRASVDGWAASTFHSGCDNKGPTVTIIKVGQYIFGGYTSDSWSKWLYLPYRVSS